MLNYLLEVTLCWGVFYLIYALLLSRQTFFVANRWYLLATLALGLFIPLVEWQPSVVVEAHPIVTSVEPLQITVQQFEQQIIVAQEQNYFNWWNMLLILYWIGVGAFTLRFGHGLWKIWETYRGSKIVQNGKYRIVYTNSKHLPYSFFHCLFWSKEFEAELSAQQQILRHEEAHINGWHTIDVLWLEVLSILFWCSPVIYLYRASMRNVHEYLADAWVLQTTNRRTYGRLLLSQSLSGFQIALANNFINSQLKKRILMMTRNESPRQAIMRYLWLLPIVLFTFLIFSKHENREVLRAQFNGLEESQPYAVVYERLEKSHDKDTWNYLAAEYGELVKKHPDMAHEIAIMAGQIAKKQGFTFMSNEFTKGVFMMLNDGDANLNSGVDRLPRFMECKRFGSSDLAKDICAESLMHEFIYRHLEYPEATKQYGYEGEIYVRMRIEADGKVSSVKTEHLRDVDIHCEQEALRIANKMIGWLPAEKNGKPVAYDFIVPFIFSPKGVPSLYAPTVERTNSLDSNETKAVNADSIPLIAAEKFPFEIIPLLAKTEDFKMSSGFGKRMHPVLKKAKMHFGIDFVANLGTPIIATADGFVKEINDYKTGYGKHLVLEHTDDFKTLYAHMSKIVAKQDDYVRKGEVIGYVGSTGFSASPHLHYEVMHKGKKINPYKIEEAKFNTKISGLKNSPEYVQTRVLQLSEQLDLEENHDPRLPPFRQDGELDKLLEYFGFKGKLELKEGLKDISDEKKVDLFRQLHLLKLKGLPNKTLEVKNLVLSPNPSEGNFNIKGKIKPGAVMIEIYTNEGKVIETKYIKASENMTGELDVDMSILRSTASDIFFVRIWQNGQMHVEQLFINK